MNTDKLQETGSFPSLSALAEKFKTASVEFRTLLMKSPYFQDKLDQYQPFLAQCDALNNHLEQCLRLHLESDINKENNDRLLSEVKILETIAQLGQDGHPHMPPPTAESRRERKARHQQVLQEAERYSSALFPLQDKLSDMACHLGLINHYFLAKLEHQKNHASEQAQVPQL